MPDGAFDVTQKKFAGHDRGYFMYGKFDSGIYEAFSECLVDGEIPKTSKALPLLRAPTRYRKEVYKKFVQQFYRLH